MTNHGEPATSDRNRFFHTMVVMGGALALGCGGLSANDDVQPIGNGGGGTGGTGPSGGGSGGTTGGFGGGGAGGMASGGTGSVIIPQGGAGQGPVEPGPFTCSPAQWSCSSSYGYCAGDGFRLPTECLCDETKPKGPEDCASGETLACQRATANESGRPFTEAVPFNCHCVVDQASCEAACDQVFFDSGTCIEGVVTRAGRSVLCGCAVIVLR